MHALHDDIGIGARVVGRRDRMRGSVIADVRRDRVCQFPRSRRIKTRSAVAVVGLDRGELDERI
jgi:hypothetical protein